MDPTTGGAKGSKPCQMGALDPVGLEQMGLVRRYGVDQVRPFQLPQGLPVESVRRARSIATFSRFSRVRTATRVRGSPHGPHGLARSRPHGLSQERDRN